MDEYKKYLIAIPCMDSIATPTVASIVALSRVGASKFSFLSNSLVHDARNMLAREAIETGADRIMFIDSDMVFASDLMERLAADLDDGLDFVSGIYVKRRLPTIPVLYKSAEIVEVDGRQKGQTQAYTDYPKDTLFEFAACGFGAVMMNVDMLIEVCKVYHEPFAPLPGMFGEDISFCYRARQLGYKLWCDSRIKLGHVGTTVFTEKHYLMQEN